MILNANFYFFYSKALVMLLIVILRIIANELYGMVNQMLFREVVKTKAVIKYMKLIQEKI